MTVDEVDRRSHKWTLDTDSTSVGLHCHHLSLIFAKNVGSSSLLQVHCKLMQCRYWYTSHYGPTKPNQWSSPFQLPHLTAPTHIEAIWKVPWRQCLLTPETASGVAQWLCILHSIWQSKALLRAPCVIRTGSISVYTAAAHVMPDHPPVLNDVIPMWRKGT